MPDIHLYDNAQHREAVIALWKAVFAYDTPHNDPGIAIDRKIAVEDTLFLVALLNEQLVGTIMAGYDGHRGWIYSIAVHPEHRKQGIGSQLLSFAESRLVSRGCVKINLQIMDGNEQTQEFYEANGYSVEKRVSMGKRLPENIGNAQPGNAGDGVGPGASRPPVPDT